MAKFKMSIQLNLSKLYTHFFQTNENTKKKSTTNCYQHNFPIENVISFTVKSLGCLEILKNSASLVLTSKEKISPRIDKNVKIPRFHRLKLFFSNIAASEYSLNSLKLSLSILNILNVC